MEYESFINRIKKTNRQRKRWAQKYNYEAYRIYDRDIPEFQYAIDKYADHVVLYDKRKSHQLFFEEVETEHTKHILKSIEKSLQIPLKNIKLKKRRKMSGKHQYEKSSELNVKIKIKEGSLTFLVNLDDYLDTGLFLDHRPTRQNMLTRKMKNFLNLFSYTSTMSVCAAMAGAKCTNVDMSKTYQEWAKENFLINNINPLKHNFIEINVLKFLKNKGMNIDKFDLIFLDPPSFSNSKKMYESFDVQRDHSNIIKQTMTLLTPNGVLLFSNNKRNFKLDNNLKNLYDIKEISKLTIPEDFRDKKIHNFFIINGK